MWIIASSRRRSRRPASEARAKPGSRARCPGSGCQPRRRTQSPPRRARDLVPRRRIAPWTTLTTRCPISWRCASICSSAVSIDIRASVLASFQGCARALPPRNAGLSHPRVPPYLAREPLRRKSKCGETQLVRITLTLAAAGLGSAPGRGHGRSGVRKEHSRQRQRRRQHVRPAVGDEVGSPGPVGAGDHAQLQRKRLHRRRHRHHQQAGRLRRKPTRRSASSTRPARRASRSPGRLREPA